MFVILTVRISASSDTGGETKSLIEQQKETNEAICPTASTVSDEAEIRTVRITSTLNRVHDTIL